MLMVDDDDEDEDEPSYAEEADALLAQMRQLRESMQQESGVLQQKAQASEQERTSAQRNLGRTVASIVDDVANMPSLMVDVANGRWADAELQPAPAAIGGARSVADGADGPSDANSQIEAELARRRGMASAPPPPPFSVLATKKGGAPVHVERRPDGGTVTILPLTSVKGDAHALLEAATGELGCGGAVGAKELELTGDVTEALEAWLLTAGRLKGARRGAAAASVPVGAMAAAPSAPPLPPPPPSPPPPPPQQQQQQPPPPVPAPQPQPPSAMGTTGEAMGTTDEVLRGLGVLSMPCPSRQNRAERVKSRAATRAALAAAPPVPLAPLPVPLPPGAIDPHTGEAPDSDAGSEAATDAGLGRGSIRFKPGPWAATRPAVNGVQARRTSRAAARAIAGYLDEDEEDEEEAEAVSGEVAGDEGAGGEEEGDVEGEQAVAASEVSAA